MVAGQGRPGQCGERGHEHLCPTRQGVRVEGAFNKQCGALAADRTFTGWATSADQRQALQKAVDECKKAGGTMCVPHIAFCSM